MTCRTLLVLLTMLGVSTGCGASSSSQAPAAATSSSPSAVSDDIRQAAQAVTDRYAALLARAVKSKPSEAAVQRVGWFKVTPAIRQNLRYYACEYGEEWGWRDDKIVGKSRFGDSDEPEEGELLVRNDGKVIVRAVVYLVHPTERSTPFFNHTLTLEQRDQRWVIVGDHVDLRPTTFALTDQAASEPPLPPAYRAPPDGASTDAASPDGLPDPKCELPPQGLLSP
jgi:hypothetical protein